MTLDRYLIRQFFPIFIVAISMFVFLLLLIDLFSNLVRYLNNEVPFLTIMQITAYYIPKSMSYAMPISLLFAAAYTLGDLYARNELTTIFSSGIPFWRFSISLVVVGLLASIFSFFLDDTIVIPTLKTKNELSKVALKQYFSFGNRDIVIKANDGRLLYSVDYYDYEKLILNGVSIIETDDNGKFVSQIRSPSAEWKETYWELKDAVIYLYENDILRIHPLINNTSYDEPPDMFRRHAVNVNDLSAREAGLLVNDLRSAGLPFIRAQANYYHRYSFAATSLIVMILSISMGGRFRKNIMLMSLFASLSVAVVYYIAEMLSMTLAGLNYIPPVVGAWLPVFLFIVIGLFMVRGAKT
ncbi:MAG: LptF/LptG family permease [Treponema sp.]|jgi:lipopolysaccharide export system permease protein|nr:LptF/LptG family permease [Treponema sp.]